MQFLCQLLENLLYGIFCCCPFLNDSRCKCSFCVFVHQGCTRCQQPGSAGSQVHSEVVPPAGADRGGGGGSGRCGQQRHHRQRSQLLLQLHRYACSARAWQQMLYTSVHGMLLSAHFNNNNDDGDGNKTFLLIRFVN